MKITEATTLAELAGYLKELGNPLITMMTAAPGAKHVRFAIAHLTNVGSFHGAGATEAEALNDALGVLRMALTPEPTHVHIRTCIVCGKKFSTFLPEVPAEHRNNAVFSSLQLCSICTQNRNGR